MNLVSKLLSANPRRVFLAASVFLALLSIVVFGIIIKKGFPDIADHNNVALRIAEGREHLPIHFLYFGLLMIPLLISKNILLVHVLSVILLTAAVLFKYRISTKIMLAELKKVSIPLSDNSLRVACFVSAFLLMISQNLIIKPSSTMMLGYLPVNTWHNSTTVFLLPFALLLFYESYRFLSDPSAKRAGFVLLLVILNLAIKPNYFLVFVMAFPLFALIRFRLTKPFFVAALLCAAGALGLLLQAKLEFTAGGNSAPLKIAPFNVWGHWSFNVPLSFISSEFFPLVFFFLYGREAKKDTMLLYAAVSAAFAILIYIVFSESGYKEFDGNFGWQVIVCNYILFLACSTALVRSISQHPQLLLKDKLALSALGLHVFIGIVYIFKSPFLNFA
jgi:hypothetical protein